MYLGDPMTSLDRSKLSAILIQVRNREAPEPWKASPRRSDDLFPNILILSLIIELGVSKPTVKSLETTRTDHFSFRVHGNGRETFGCWEITLNQHLKDLLGFRWDRVEEMERNFAQVAVNFTTHSWAERYPGFSESMQADKRKGPEPEEELEENVQTQGLEEALKTPSREQTKKKIGIICSFQRVGFLFLQTRSLISLFIFFLLIM